MIKTRKIKNTILVVMLISLLLVSSFAYADEYKAEYSRITNTIKWNALIDVSINKDFVIASTKIDIAEKTSLLYCQVELKVVQKNILTGETSVKESSMVSDYCPYGSHVIFADPGYIIESAEGYHEVYYKGFTESIELVYEP